MALNNAFARIKSHLYYDIDLNDPEVTVDYVDISDDLTITVGNSLKFCSKFDGMNIYGPIYVENTNSSFSSDDYQEATLTETSFIQGQVWNGSPVGLWTFTSILEDENGPEIYTLNAKVKYDDNGNVKKTKIWEPESYVYGGHKSKPYIKIDRYHHLTNIFYLS